MTAAPSARAAAPATSDATTTVTAGALWPLFVAAFSATFTFSVSTVVAPVLARDLPADRGQVALFMGTFAAAFAAFLILAGRLGDRYGRRRLFGIGLTGAAVTGVLAAVAPSIGFLIVARVLQGAFAAMVMPQILGTIQASTTGPERARGVSLFAASSGVGTAAGQIIGGGLVSLDVAGTSWRGALLSVAVINAIALVGVPRLPATRSPERSGLDYGGAALVGVALMALVAGLSLGPSQHWSVGIDALIVAGIAGLAAFWWSQLAGERTGRSVLTPPSVVRLRPVWTGLLMAMLFFAGFGAFMYDFSVLTQTGFGLSPAWSGAALVLFAAVFVVTSTRIATFTGRFGERTMEYAGALQIASLLVMAALAVVAHLTDRTTAWVWWAQIVFVPLGIAQAAQFGPLLSTVMRHVPDRVAGLTGGMVATAQQTALGLCTATIGSFFLSAAGWWDWQLAFAAAIVLQALAGVAFVALAVNLRRSTAAIA